MKNISLVLVTFLLVATSVNAQEISKNAIGLRLGDSDGFGAEINYQRALDEDNRLELGLSFRDTKRVNAYKITGIYQWVWNIDGGFNWYAGPGAGIGQIGFEDEFFDDRSNETFVFAAGDIVSTFHYWSL